MSYSRRHSRPDEAQEGIVKALRKAGVYVAVIGSPVDLLTYYKGRWLPIECKTPGKRPRKDQEAQNLFVATYAVPVVRNELGALAAVTLHK